MLSSMHNLSPVLYLPLDIFDMFDLKTVLSKALLNTESCLYVTNEFSTKYMTDDVP